MNTNITPAVSASNGKNNVKTDLFVYGTLMRDEHVKLLINRKVNSVPAVLPDYMKVTPNNAFFFIVGKSGSQTSGRLLTGLSKEELERIDSFEDEGHLYFRKKAIVRVGEEKLECDTYVGNVPALQKTFGNNAEFEDRYEQFLEKKIDDIIDSIPTNRPDIARRVVRELIACEADNIVQSHFEGNYICKYIMLQTLREANPPSLRNLLETKELLPYAGNYMRLVSQHIVFNQLVSMLRRDFSNAVRLSEQYYRHGLGILLGFLLYNKNKDRIDALFKEKNLDTIVEGMGYRDYARVSVEIADLIYDRGQALEVIDYVEQNWYSTPTPIGAELEFSQLGKRAVCAEPGEDKLYDGFYWFNDFSMPRRTWRLGGHVDSHRSILPGQKRHRGFFEYALGRYQIVGDLSRPLFDCPWGMSVIINEVVKFLAIKPHSLHVSMELGGQHSNVTDKRHREEDLVCLLMLGGELRKCPDGKLREWRIYNEELDTNFKHSLHFSDRKCHFSRPDQDESEAAEIMEYKFMRLNSFETDYEKLIVALKGYQFETHARPISIPKAGEIEMPEQIFLRRWAKNPEPLDKAAINGFLKTVEKGLLEENKACKLDQRKKNILLKIEQELLAKNELISANQP
ncbi:MAG: hypothetical protein A2020_03800 [Lentisphaerae bacterium GWF2_45_14]|nr:MAG: hypothetical protein A2020_03800 [Lentisphaerae bacterium GWF2_45_14]